MTHFKSVSEGQIIEDSDNSINSVSLSCEHDEENVLITSIYVDDGPLRPPFTCRKSYTVLLPYKPTGFGEVTLKKTRNGKKAKSGVQLERSISPKRSTIS